MREFIVEDMLETCLQRYHSGENLEGILADYPEQAGELRPLLEAAVQAYQVAGEIRVPPAAQSLSRAKFLTAAAQAQNEPKGLGFHLFHFRLAASSLVAAVVVAAVLTVTGFASFTALPGDVFYPVKRIVEQIQIDFVQDPPARLVLEENFDDRRVAEVEQLNRIQRREFVTFSGLLERNALGIWRVGSLKLDVPPDITDLADMEGWYVQVSGYSDSKVVMVEQIQPRQYHLDGVLQIKDRDQWLVNGVNIVVDERSQVSGASVVAGARVQIEAVRLQDNRYLVQRMVVSPLPTAMRTATAELKASRTPVPGSQLRTPQPTEKQEERKTEERKSSGEPSKPAATATRRSEDGDNRTPTKSSESRLPSPTVKPVEVKDPTRTPTQHN